MAIYCAGNVGTIDKPRACGQEKFISALTGIGVCPECDVEGELIWPNDYLEWTKDMPFPGEVEKEESD